MKNLANCTPREFLAQTVKIKRAVEKWLTITDIANIRKRVPAITEDMTKADKKKAIDAQVAANLSAIFDEVAEKHPDETITLMALTCFVEPNHVNDYPITDYLTAISEMIGNDAVIGFFSSLVKLARTGILKA